MATIIHSVSGVAPLHLGARLRLSLAQVTARFAARRERARILRELNQLEERDLQDLGLSRYDFKGIAEGRVTR